MKNNAEISLTYCKINKIKAGSGPKPWITCARPGLNCAHPTGCSRNNKCYYS